MKLGSLFDGSGTAPLAASMCGITPVWASEIEAYPIKVTTARFPNMLHLGDITKIDGAVVEPVDIICGGSPCQDLSVAGKQAGLHEGERSHLFFEMTRIIKEMRGATNGKYPRYIIWENVPGAFSSNKGKDFLAVLQAFAEIADPDVHVPEPPCRGKTDRLAWQYAGSIVGDGWSIAWRTVDAQYWGVPQRRRRIYLVADFADERAGEILFERKGMSGDSEPGRTQRKEATGDAGRGVEGSCDVVYPLNEQIILRHNKLGRGTGFGAGEAGDPAYTLQANHPHMIAAGFVGRQGAKSGSVGFDIDIAPTLRQGITTDVVHESWSCSAKQQSLAIERECAATIGANDYKEPQVVFDITGVTSNSMKSPTPDSCFKQRDIGRTLDTFVGSPECNQGGMVVVKRTVYPVVTGPLMANSHPGSYTGQDAFNGMLPVIPSDKPPRKYIVRRLTPLECCRLQGFPDWWEDGVEGSDSARYKMWGNGMALPNMLHVMRGIARVEGENK